MMRLLTLLAALALAHPLLAQTFPDRQGGINDYADLLTPETETRLEARVSEIIEDHGAEVAVVTLSSLQFYANDSTIEDYSQDLFNAWGLGDADANTGLLILVFRDDREVRLEMGSGWDEAAQDGGQQVVDADILPRFEDGDLPAGIEAGIGGLVTRVIDPAPAPASPDSSESGSSNVLYYVLGGVAALVAGGVALNRRAAAKLAATPCAACGAKGLRRSCETLRPATETNEGAGETRITCPTCGHVEVTPYVIPKTENRPKGGGKTDGAGATGKW